MILFYPATVVERGLRAAVFMIAAVFALTLFPACGGHQPAQVEEQSTLVKKRRLNFDGTYSVRTGDTLYAIAFHYGMDPQELAGWNGIARPYVIYPGQKLRMLAPKPGTVTRKDHSSVKVSAVKPPAQATTRPAVTAKPAAAAERAEPMVKTQVPAVKPEPIPLDADPVNWRWPTQGRILRGFVANNPSRNGLDITGREGQAVNATAAGQVVYSGNGLIGYGELIIIRHSEKMLSAYAHNKVRLVKEHDRVTAGQKIAEMGRNTSNETLLHFEIRVRGKPVNPLNYLPER
ncbi:MAG: peptidoglycan DD-metalloendopeptidase family protein [Xanthomonadales bacterium]|nr:peptidoglycan DD-metalloendopeptidase family protein [Xanthomonadales bacterium]